MTLEAVHRLATENSPEIQTILDNVVFLLVPSLNPDGQIMVIDWYNKNLGTPYENAPMPWLYHHLCRSRQQPRCLHVHPEGNPADRQDPISRTGSLRSGWTSTRWEATAPRIFVMPAMDPINPNVDPLIYRNTGLLGFAQAAALERAGKEGIIYGEQYTYWWEGAMAWAGWWHNMLGLLTEVASVAAGHLGRAGEGRPRPGAAGREAGAGEEAAAREPGGLLPAPSDVQFRSNYPRPWLGGRWTLRDIVDYDLIATFGLLQTAADLRVQLLDGLYSVGKRQIEMGKQGDPYAIVIPREQADRPTVVKLLQTLALGGVEVHQAQAPFTADGVNYPAGDVRDPDGTAVPRLRQGHARSRRSIRRSRRRRASRRGPL